MNSPKLDGRTVSDILALIGKKSRAYTPEWKFNENDPDGGTALAVLFSEMFCGTVDRLDRFPDKCSLEFLNLLGVSAKPVSPAVGVASARLADGTQERVFIKKGSQLFTDLDSERIVFETAQGYFAVPAALTDIFMTDPQNDVITRTDVTDGGLSVKPFRPDAKQNIERHSFTLCEDSVLKLDGAAEITLALGGSFGVKDDERAAMLCQSDSVTWTMAGTNGAIPLEAAPGNGSIILTKPAGKAARVDENNVPDEENGHYRITCEMKRTGNSEPIAADAVLISSRSTDEPETFRGRTPDKMYFNDTELPGDESVYPFGREPNAYDSLYICSDEVFSKAGALVTLDVSVATVIVQDGEQQNEPDFEQKLLVDKSDIRVKQPDDIFVSEVLWEYWNGLGWARLSVTGDLDMFSCSGQDGKRRISFICPSDMEASVQNSSSGLWIRARVRDVKNRFSMNGRWLIPLVRTVDLRFDYGSEMRPASEVTTCNSCRMTTYQMNGTRTRMELFSLMPDVRRTVYFRFDQPPCGLPVNLYLGFDGEITDERALNFSCCSASQPGNWSELKVTDGTRGFCGSGIISMYVPDDIAETEIFGVKGYWIRAEEPFGSSAAVSPTLITAEMNAVDLIQQISVAGERNSAAAGKKNHKLHLIYRPVINCEVWVNELGETPVSELQSLSRDGRTQVRVVNGPDGLPAEWWVKWECTESLAGCGAESRCYELDSSTGVITFGDGTNGKIPAYSADADVSINYSWGGGTSGNLPAGALDGLITGIPFVESMTNILPTCGGSNAQSLDKIRKIGAQRIRHGGRAVTVRDYEGIIAEEFSEVGEVKCFSGANSSGAQESGCVTVVIKPADMGTASYALSLCRRIEEYLRTRACCEPVFGGRLAVIPVRPLKISADISVVIKNVEFAAQTEREIIHAVTRLTDKATACIGAVPCENDIYAALKGVQNVAYATRVLLTGEYSGDGVSAAIPLDRKPDYPYFLPVTGVHTVRIDGASGL